MKITACLIAKDPMRTTERSAWFMQALLSTRIFAESIVCVEGEFNKGFVKTMAPKASVIHLKEHKSAEEAIMLSVEAAGNDWVSIGCDDDYWAPENVRILQDQIMPERPSVVYFPYYVIKPEEGKFGVHFPPAPSMENLATYNFISVAAVTHKDVFLKTGGFLKTDDIASDWFLWIRAKKAGFPFIYFPLPAYYQRFYGKSYYQRQLESVGAAEMMRRVRELAGLPEKRQESEQTGTNRIPF